MNKKESFGQILKNHLDKKIDIEDDIIEYRKPMERKVINDIHQTISKAKSQELYKNKDFYIVVLMKTEIKKLVPRTLTLARRSCPTPVYNQSVFKYHHISGVLEFLWSIPDSILYYHILRNKEQYLSDPECADLAKFVILMESGELLTWVKKENGEKVDAVIFNNKEIQ